MEEMNITTFDMEDMNLTTIGMLQKVGHPSYEFFDWKFKAELFVFAENFWPRVRGSSDNKILEYWMDIAKFLEMDHVTWRSLINMFRQGDPGRACAKLTFWALLNQAAVMDHVDISQYSTSILGDYRDLKNVWQADRIMVATSDLLEQRPSGLWVKSPFQILKEYDKEFDYHTSSGIPGGYMLKQECRVWNLKLAFEFTLPPPEAPEGPPVKRSRTSVSTQASSNS